MSASGPRHRVLLLLLSVGAVIAATALALVPSSSSAEPEPTARAQFFVVPDQFGQHVEAQAVAASVQYEERRVAEVEAQRVEAERVAAEAAARAAEEQRRVDAREAARQAAPSTTAAPARTGACAGLEEVIGANFPADQVSRACRVMMCESGGNPTADNPRSSASGLFQFLDSTWRSVTGRIDRALNASVGEQVAAAARLFRSSGWSPWSCR